MDLAAGLGLALLLIVGGYIFAVGIMPELFTWILDRFGSRARHSGQ